MKARYSLPVILVLIYIALELFFLVNSGAGHGWGTGAMVIITFPTGLIALAADDAFPRYRFVLALPVLGLLQYMIVGYVIGRRIENRRIRK